MSAALNRESSNAVGFSNPELSTADFNIIAGLVRDASGIQLSETKLGLAKSRLQKRLRVYGMSNFAEYVRLVQSPEGEAEMEELICAMSTNVTAFNREPHHFVHFREEVIPELKKRLSGGDPVRIWSAGCSNGSEPYTVACAMLDAMPDVARHNFRILATDIDKYCLDTGRQGLYPHDMVSKMAPETLSKWFVKTDQGYQIDDKPQALVSFKALNLMAPWPHKMKYDVVFCRNVLIYFSQEDQGKLFVKFADTMKPGATFFIGHSERLVGPAAERFSSIGATTYRREG